MAPNRIAWQVLYGGQEPAQAGTLLSWQAGNTAACSSARFTASRTDGASSAGCPVAPVAASTPAATTISSADTLVLVRSATGTSIAYPLVRLQAGSPRLLGVHADTQGRPSCRGRACLPRANQLVCCM